jgi:NCAIR mutase (PurE)-related protein
LRDLLEDVERGGLSVEEALERLKGFPYEDLGFARLDSHRTLRKGFPEVIFCPGKTEDRSCGSSTASGRVRDALWRPARARRWHRL